MKTSTVEVNFCIPIKQFDVAVEILAHDEEIEFNDAANKLYNFMKMEHDGDCTKKPFTCYRCEADKYLDIAMKILKRLKK